MTAKLFVVRGPGSPDRVYLENGTEIPNVASIGWPNQAGGSAWIVLELYDTEFYVTDTPPPHQGADHVHA